MKKNQSFRELNHIQFPKCRLGPTTAKTEKKGTFFTCPCNKIDRVDVLALLKIGFSRKYF